MTFFFFFFFFPIRIFTLVIFWIVQQQRQERVIMGDNNTIGGKSLVGAEKKYEFDVCEYAQVYLYVIATLINQARIPSNELSLVNV